LALPADCPPATASSHAGTVYRLVNSSPPTGDDFRTYFVLYPGRQWTKKELCPAHGLSVRLNPEVAMSELERFKARIKGATWHVASAVLVSADGPVDQTFSQKTHYTWWPRDEFDFLAAFSVLMS
jgi:hypothetical protein